MTETQYQIFNFPVSYIPKIIDDVTILEECLSFGLIRASGLDEIDPIELERTMDKFQLHANKGTPSRDCMLCNKLMKRWKRNREPLTYIHTDAFFRYMCTQTEPKERMALALLLAFRSIGRTRRENFTNIEMLKARMSGYSKPGAMIRCDVERWMTRRKFDSLKSYLAERKFLYFKKGKQKGIVFYLDKNTYLSKCPTANDIQSPATRMYTK